MHVKKGDNVIVTTGKDKGKSGKILRAFPSENKVLVEGLNLKKVYDKPKTKGRTKAVAGKLIEKAYPFHASNVKLVKSK